MKNRKEKTMTVGKAVRKIILYLVLLAIVLAGICYGVVFAIPPQFRDSFQSVINRKYENLLFTEGPKIIFTGGSSGLFGMDADTLSELTGYPVVNLATHAGFGNRFQTNICKANIDEGDIVVLGYEYTQWYSRSAFGAELVITGIENNFGLYQYIPKESLVDVIRYFPKYLCLKLDSLAGNGYQYSGPYNAKAYDEKGNLRMAINFSSVTDPKEDVMGTTINIRGSAIMEENLDYVNDFVEYCEERGAKVVITFPPLWEEACTNSPDEWGTIVDVLEEKCLADVISDPADYVWEKAMFYDTHYHCTTAGMARRTQQLAEDINAWLAGE